MSAQQPPRSSGKNPNLAPKSSSDAKAASGTCPLMKNKVQLLPLRYGLVERLDPSAEITVPYRLKSRPLGMRLLRDGWLYVIDNSTGYLHEYRVEKGQVTKFIWRGKEAAQDKRQGNAAEPRLVFPRGTTLHISYSEVQWTAFKCSQMLRSREERDCFMQIVDLAKADCEKGGTHLLTAKQAEKWLAEVSEKPASSAPLPGAAAEEGKDYSWEHQPLFHKTQMGEVKKTLIGDYEHNHLYLVLKDSIGVMRDLAEEQDHVVGWIDKWATEQRKELKYVIGSYIETLMVVNDSSGRQAGADKLYGKTAPAQREKIYEYINARNKWLWERRRPPVAQKVNGYYTRAVGPDPRTLAARQAMDAKKKAMVEALGEDLYDELEDDIEKLEDQSSASLEGKGLGARGIHDLVRHEEMGKYLESERIQLKRWVDRLNRITDDRVSIFTKGEFHHSAWYFDAQQPDQLMAALVTEQNCVRDLCRTEESLKSVSEYFHKYPYYVMPAFASRLDQAFLMKKSGDLTKWLDDLRNLKGGLEDAKNRLSEVEGLMGRYWANGLNMSPAATNASHAVNAAYSPAIALRLEKWLADLQQQLEGPAIRQHLDKLASQTNRAQRLGSLMALQQEGATLAVATEHDVQQFRSNIARFTDFIQNEDRLVKERDKAKSQSKRRSLSEPQRQAAKALKQQLNQQLSTLRKQRALLGNQLQESLTPTSTIPAGFVGARLKLDAGQQGMLEEEIRKLRSGVLGGYSTAGSRPAAFKSSLLPLLAVYLQARNLGEALDNWRNISGSPSIKEQIIFYGAFAAVSSAALSVYQAAHIALIDKALMATVANTSGKGGMLFAAKLGKLGLGLGVLISPAALLGAVGTTLDNWGKWTDAFRVGTAGEKAGALLAITGDIGSTTANAAITAKAYKELWGVFMDMSKAAPGQRTVALSAGWATRGARFLSLSARLNPWALAFTALQLGGEALYNYFNLDDQQRWMLGCCWGREDKGWDWPTHAQKLAEANLKPVIADKGITQREKDGEHTRTLLLSLPGISPDSLNRQPLRMTAEWHAQISRPPEDVGQVLRDNIQIASSNPLTLQLEIPADWCGSQSLLMLRLAVQPELATQPLKASDGYLYYRVPLEVVAMNKPIEGASAIKPTRTPLSWVEIKTEHMHA